MGKSTQTKADRKKEIVKALCYDVTIDKAREIKKGNQGGYMPVLLAWLDVLRNMCQGRVQFDPFGRLKVTQ